MNGTAILYKGIDTTYLEYIAFTEKDVNNSIFLTKEEAEQALKESTQMSETKDFIQTMKEELGNE